MNPENCIGSALIGPLNGPTCTPPLQVGAFMPSE
jgi:hypothetical protein